MSSKWVQKLTEDLEMNIEKARQEARQKNRRREPRVQMFSAIADTNEKGDNNAVLLVGALVLAVVMVAVFVVKDRLAVAQPYSPVQGYVSQEQLYTQNLHKNVVPQYDPKELYNMYEKYDANNKTFWEHQTWTQDRLALLAIVVNHNAEVDRLNRPKSELVVLHQDWTLSQFPYLVRMTPEDEAFVRQFLR